MHLPLLTILDIQPDGIELHFKVKREQKIPPQRSESVNGRLTVIAKLYEGFFQPLTSVKRV